MRNQINYDVHVRQVLLDLDLALEHDLDSARRAASRLKGILLPPPPTTSRGGLLRWQMRRVREYMELHLEKPIKLLLLAREVSLSSSYFSRAFKESFGQTPHSYVMQLRIERAKQLITTTRLPLSQVAIDVGLCDQSHLTRLFRKLSGMTPSAWRRQHGNECAASTSYMNSRIPSIAGSTAAPGNE